MRKKVIFEKSQFKRLIGNNLLEISTPDNLLAVFKDSKPNNLLEGYFSTYPYEKIKKYVTKLLGIPSEYFYQAEMENGENIIVILVPLNQYNKELVSDTMSMCGYYLCKEVKNEKLGCYVLQYDKRYQNKINDIVKEKQFLYHLTSTEFLPKIQKQGLIPKAKNTKFSYPDRIYFFLDKPDIESVCDWSYVFFDSLDTNKQKHMTGDYTLLKIDVSKLSEIDFFYDPYLSDGVYTKENIIPNAIEIEYKSVPAKHLRK